MSFHVNTTPIAHWWVDVKLFRNAVSKSVLSRVWNLCILTYNECVWMYVRYILYITVHFFVKFLSLVDANFVSTCYFWIGSFLLLFGIQIGNTISLFGVCIFFKHKFNSISFLYFAKKIPIQMIFLHFFLLLL